MRRGEHRRKDRTVDAGQSDGNIFLSLKVLLELVLGVWAAVFRVLDWVDTVTPP